MHKVITTAKPLVALLETLCRTIISFIVSFYSYIAGLDLAIIAMLIVLLAFWSALPSVMINNRLEGCQKPKPRTYRRRSTPVR